MVSGRELIIEGAHDLILLRKPIGNVQVVGFIDSIAENVLRICNKSKVEDNITNHFLSSKIDVPLKEFYDFKLLESILLADETTNLNVGAPIYLKTNDYQYVGFIKQLAQYKITITYLTGNKTDAEIMHSGCMNLSGLRSIIIKRDYVINFNDVTFMTNLTDRFK